jgi:exonuclease III
VIRLLSWNTDARDLWNDLEELDGDVGLLQEVGPLRPGCAKEIIPGDADVWATAGSEKRAWRTAVARLSDRVALDARPTLAMHETTRSSDWTVSRQGTMAAADAQVNGHVAFTAVSVYAPWERPVGRDEPVWADGSAHRLLSDLTPLLWDQRRHPVIIAGDWNILFGYGERGDPHFRNRYQTVFDRVDALGLQFVGPQHPDGRQAHPWPDELPRDSMCVPTFHHSQQTPETASRQLDFVFASAGFADKVHARALNEATEWGPSDHLPHLDRRRGLNSAAKAHSATERYRMTPGSVPASRARNARISHDSRSLSPRVIPFGVANAGLTQPCAGGTTADLGLAFQCWQ